MSQNEFEKKLATCWMPEHWRDITILLAVSGGADSVSLVRGIAALKSGVGSGSVLVAHFNHRWRGAESDADERFVVELCEQLEVPCIVQRAAANPVQVAAGQGREALARNMRYEFLQTAAKEYGARFLVTAHTADDQAETILHRILRGTGVAGLAGIARVRSLNPQTSLIRPLLSFTRQEVLAYLQEIDQLYCEDASNRDLHFTRNRIRHDLLPRLQADYNPQVAEAILRLGTLAGEAQEEIDGLVEKVFDQAVKIDEIGKVTVDCTSLSDARPFLVRELFVAIWKRRKWPLQAMSYEKWSRLTSLATSDFNEQLSRKEIFPGEIEVERVGRIFSMSKILY